MRGCGRLPETAGKGSGRSGKSLAASFIHLLHSSGDAIDIMHLGSESGGEIPAAGGGFLAYARVSVIHAMESVSAVCRGDV